MATKQERDAKKAELDAVETEFDEKLNLVAEARTPYKAALADAQETWDRFTALEDEYEAMVVQHEPPTRPSE